MNMLYLGFLLVNLEGPREFKGGAQQETPLLTVPLFHATGLLSGFFVPMQMGHKLVMMYRWDSHKALQLIETEKVTALSSVPTIIQDLLAHPEFDRYDTSSLIRVAAAGAATPAGLPELIEAKCGNPSRAAGYGMTETMAVASTMSGTIYDFKPNSSGVVSPIMQIRFVDSEGRVLPSGEQGEIQFKSVLCMPGYWEKPDANRQVFTEDGWLRSGDIGMLDRDGFMHITGRIKEIVIRGGENIYPGEIENIAYRHDAIQEVVVFGVNDPEMGEALALVCYLRQGSTLDAIQLRQFLGERLAGYKVPKYIAFSAQPLPRNASEKLHKLNVKATFLDGEYRVQ
jgi:long-chain acyl-CoA synthetase